MFGRTSSSTTRVSVAARTLAPLRRSAGGRIAAVGVFALALATITPGAAHADPPVQQNTVVSAVPQTNTPDVQDGVVYAIGQLGNKMFLGGKFSSVAEHGGVNAVPRTNIVAFDATTGKIDQGFNPSINGEVDAVIPGPGNSVFVAGKFTTVNGATTRVDRLDATTGARVAGWTPPSLNGITQTLTTLGNTLYIGGAFTKASSTSHAGLVAVNATTGSVIQSMTVQLTGRHGTGSRKGPLGPKRIAIDPSGTEMVVIGNFTTAANSAGGTTYADEQVVRLSVTPTTAAVETNWSTQRYTAQCANNAFDSYIRDVQFSPDGKYFVIVATGGGTFDRNTDGTRSLCDTAARWETSDSGSNVQPTWIDYTGNDTFWSVAVTGTAIYAGGHQRWVNNTSASDSAGEGAVPRPGIAALDPVNGMPLSWNPGRNPRGAGAYALLATPTGLWVGSDTDFIGSYKYKHQKIAFFPLAGGYAVPPNTVGTLPGNVFEAGPLANQHPEVLYRVDAGGPTVAANDGGPDWVADNSDPSPYRNSGSNTAGWSPLQNRGNIPASTPSDIFNLERWDPGSHNDGGEMQWNFPVPTADTVTVRLFFANRCTCTSGVGQRAFDVAIEGNTVLDHYDIVSDVGDQTATMKQFTGITNNDGNVTIDFTHEVENPLINGIEIIQTSPAPPPPGNGDSLTAIHLGADNSVGTSTTVDTNTMDWTQVRGAFMVNGELYYGKTDGTFNERTFDGTTLGAEVNIDPYNDPFWSTIKNGSGGTYRGLKSDLYGQLPSISSMFFLNGRIYYTLVGQSGMFYRYFTPDSGVIGADQFTVNDGGMNWSDVAGAFVTGNTLYYATKSDGGNLHAISWATDHATGSPTLVDNTEDWAAHSLFLRSDDVRVNKPPVAAFTFNCASGTLSCSFDAGSAIDPDGSIADYGWNFGDGNGEHHTDSTVSHTYASAGNKTVVLTVTDNDGASTSISQVVHPTTAHSVISFVGETDQATRGKNVQLGVPSGVNPGDTLLLFETWNSPGVSASTPAGYTLQQSYTNASGIKTNVYSKVAVASDVGGTAMGSFGSGVKFTATLAAYTGTSGAPIGVIASANDSGTSNHVTPTVTVPNDGSYALSYWADKSAASPTTWTTPSDVTRRAVDFAGGTGTVSTQLGDSASQVNSGPYGGKVASVDSNSAKGISITLSLNPLS